MPLEELLREGTAVPITRWDTPVMHRPARRVEDFGPALWNLLATMFATNRAAQGAGLAAPQIGVDLAVFVYDTIDDEDHRHTGLVCNPVLELPQGKDRRLVEEYEGCLSLPGAYSLLARPDFAMCHGQDQFGEPVTVRGTGYFARCLQHESDHLAGIVMEDRLTSKARKAHRRQHQDNAVGYPTLWPASAPSQEYGQA